MSISIVFFGVIVSSLVVADHAVFGFTINDNNVIDASLLTEKIGTNRTIKVDINGDGDYKSVQQAINYVPNGNSQWIIIHVRKGIYREKIHIPKEKQYIFMRGNGKGKTHIVWDRCSENNTDSATLRVDASNFVAFGISFKNNANIGLPYEIQNEKQSVAALVGGDKVAFYHCAFYSAHNTLFDYKGRHFYEDCYVQGSIDFIFGRARSIFHKCEIFVVSDDRVEIGGSITAQSRESAGEKSGLVFVEGRIYGVGGVYLGRAKGAYSRVIFAKTYLSKTIVPQGWTNWSYNGTVKNLFQGEYKCYGPGSNTANRAPWALQLDEEEVAPFISVNFIDGSEWLPAHRLLKA
ncbi:Pectinesterase [Thalictrum thalictroides]|uniref:Pectinesterase n=1 Tax=Thalictrum thalictroides TaxID=46969 RepID=A0A7J6UXH2_THATH|nr:Pectinesterase [Thalictrum thalictroides]